LHVIVQPAPSPHRVRAANGRRPQRTAGPAIRTVRRKRALGELRVRFGIAGPGQLGGRPGGSDERWRGRARTSLLHSRTPITGATRRSPFALERSCEVSHCGGPAAAVPAWFRDGACVCRTTRREAHLYAPCCFVAPSVVARPAARGAGDGRGAAVAGGCCWRRSECDAVESGECVCVGAGWRCDSSGGG
jgi:hypothetical protein